MYDLRLQFAAEVCVLGGGTTCLSSLGAALAAHIIHERMSMRGSAQLLKLLSDHNVIRTGMQNRMDNEHEWIGMIPEFRVANLNRRCYDPEVVQADNEDRLLQHQLQQQRLRCTLDPRQLPFITSVGTDKKTSVIADQVPLSSARTKRWVAARMSVATSAVPQQAVLVSQKSTKPMASAISTPSWEMRLMPRIGQVARWRVRRRQQGQQPQ